MPPKLKRVVRLDSLPLNQTYFTAEGYLVDRPILTSVGIFEYTNPDGSIRRELRLPEEVFKPESLKSYKGKPIIITHDAGLITKDNVHENAVGTILSEGYRSGDDVRAEIIIHDTDEMKSAGLKELSLGYNLDLDETPGVWNGQPYDAIQRNIVINHLALVLEARAGDQARLNIDARDRKTKGAKRMSAMYRKKPQKRTRRADGILSPEELARSIAEYKARRARRLAEKIDEDDIVNPTPVPKKDATVPMKKAAPAKPLADGEDEPIVVPAGQDGLEDPAEQIQLVKDRRDRRDQEGDPVDKKAAMGVIAQQDGDMDILFNIIDSLLAERDMNTMDCTSLDACAKDGCAKDGDDFMDPALNDDEDEMIDPAISKKDGQVGLYDPKNEDEDDDIVPVGKQFVKQDEEMDPEEPVEENTDEDDDPIPSTNSADVGKSVLNVDSIDKIVRQRINLGMVGRALHIDGLENMNITAAKKVVIRAVQPSLRLDGKSKAYINAAFDCAVATVKSRNRKDVSYQKRQMFNADSRNSYIDNDSSLSARQRMIDRQMNRKKKEDK